MIDLSIKVRACYWSQRMTHSWKTLSAQRETETYKQWTTWPWGLDKQKWEKYEVQGQELQLKFVKQAGSLLVGKNNGEDRAGSTNASWGNCTDKEMETSLQKTLVRSHLKEVIILVTHFHEKFLWFCSNLNCSAWVSQGTESSEGD